MNNRGLLGNMIASDFVTCDQCGKDSGHPIMGSECAYCFECDYVIKSEGK